MAAAAGAAMANYNNELIKCLEDLRDKRDALNKTIQREEKTKLEIQKRIAKLQEELQRVTESLNAKTAARIDFDQTIAETEAAYMKILESSQTLLHVLKRETVALVAKRSGGTPTNAATASATPALTGPSSSSAAYGEHDDDDLLYSSNGHNTSTTSRLASSDHARAPSSTSTTSAFDFASARARPKK